MEGVSRVQPVGDMDDEQFMRHMEKRHSDALKMTFKVEPDRTERRLRSPQEWRTFHDKIHELDHEGKYDDHIHRGME
jgi:hypothetical protein